MSSPGFPTARPREANWEDLEMRVLRKSPFLNVNGLGRKKEGLR